MIIPPTTLNTSSEMPKMLKTLSPTSAEPISMTRMLRATLTAARCRSGAVKVGRQVQKQRAANHGIDDRQDGNDRLQNLVKVCHEIGLTNSRAFSIRQPAGRVPPTNAAAAPAVTRLRSRYSNEKIFFQSFFMLITVQPFFFASS